MRKPKRTKVSERVSSGKRARISPESPDRQYPLWSFRYFDNDGRWCWSKICEPDAMALLQRLKYYESMTWAEIRRASHCHFIEPHRISKDAQDRLVALGRYETNSLFSLSLGGKPRVWGILQEHVMFTLWWDPDHEIFPTQPR
jgi:hypothetical protein